MAYFSGHLVPSSDPFSVLSSCYIQEVFLLFSTTAAWIKEIKCQRICREMISFLQHGQVKNRSSITNCRNVAWNFQSSFQVSNFCLTNFKLVIKNWLLCNDFSQSYNFQQFDYNGLKHNFPYKFTVFKGIRSVLIRICTELLRWQALLVFKVSSRRGNAEGGKEEIIVRREDVASPLGQLWLHLFQKERIGERTKGSAHCAEGRGDKDRVDFWQNISHQIGM